MESFHRERESIHYYKGVALPINADQNYKCIPSLVEKLADEFWAALALHKKVVAVRIDLHTFSDESGNKSIEDMLRWLKQDLERNYRMNNVGHFWAREYGKKKKLHWHLVILLDGNILQNSWAVNDKIKSYWEQTRKIGEVKIPRNCFNKIKCGDADSFEKAFYRSSYLTKERSKFVGNSRSYGASRLTLKQNNT